MKSEIVEIEGNSLQKFTDSDSVAAILRSVYKLTPDHISLLSLDKKEELGYYIRHQLQTLEGEAYEAFYFKVKDILADRLKNVTWDKNHERIKRAIKQFVITHKHLPTITQVAEMVQMSRVTVTNHMKEFDLLDYGYEQKQMLNIMFDDLMGKLFADGMNGDFASIRLFMEISVKRGDNIKPIFKAKNQQNNFIMGG